MEGLTLRGGYYLGPNQRADDILKVEAELLRSEGIDPAWPPFVEDEREPSSGEGGA